MFAVESYAAVRQFVVLEGHSRREAARVRSEPRDGGQDVPLLPSAGLHADEAGGEAEAGPAVAGDRRDPGDGPDGAFFQRLRDEHGFAGGYTVVKDYVRISRARGPSPYRATATATGLLLLRPAGLESGRR
jgi:hypothetical protein